MSAIGNEMILASAGSGKTYQLTNRFVKLLALGVPPERIVALTFTRKAAGEFFDEILKKLARAATDPAYAAKLACDLALPATAATSTQCHLISDIEHNGGRAKNVTYYVTNGSGVGQEGAEGRGFLRLLRGVVEAMPRLNLGTLDGFFARVVRSFPLELGLAGEFQVMEEAAAQRERRRVLRRIYATAGEPDAAQREFIEAFKRATFGLDEKRLTGVLDGFLDDYAETYLDAPAAAQWGEAAAIWPEGCACLDAANDRTVAEKAWRDAVPWGALNDKQRARLETFFAELSEWSPGAPLPDAVEYLVKNAFKAWPALEEIIVEYKKVALDPAARAALQATVLGIAGAELHRRLEMTRGVYRVLRGYEHVYHETVRRAGRLTFADVLRLLLPEAGAPALGDAAAAADEARLAIDWRLDARFDHWLLDEFQDTSHAQWSVLRNLIDEAVQDPERRRSLFYVGDVKQAIFAWRGGDPRLFREIFDHYNAADHGAIAERHLDDSWRSGPAPIAMVNRVFGDAAALAALVPAHAVESWTREWGKHGTAKPDLGGFAELRHAADREGRFAETLRLLREIEPQRRGLEVAVLVQKNDTGAELADYLRREGNLPAVAESDRHVATDNPFTAALLALLRAAAHPGDTLACEHLRMSPLGPLLDARGLASPAALTAQLLAELHADGFATTLERWRRRLAPAIAGDAFSAERGRMLVTAAAEFDENGSRDVAEFLEFAERYTVRDTDTAGVVRVMTIHKAKGLGFDLVILPDLEGQTLAKRREGLAVRKAPDRSVAWVLDLPAKLFVEHEPVLAAHVAEAEADAAYEALCLLYVAMTRAKRAMYVVTEPAAAKSTSRNFPRLLRDTLGETWSAGDPQWYEKLPFVPATDADIATDIVETPVPAEAAAATGAGVSGSSEPGSAGGPGERGIPFALPPRAPRLLAQRPSAMHAEEVSAAAVFTLEESGGSQFGTEVHALFAEVEWGGAETAEALATAWTARGVPAEAIDEALACLRAPALAEVWRQPACGEVWRERAFEVVLDGVWVTGVCDRVVVERGADGRAVRATVFDFKTDRVTTEADVAAARARHAVQLNVYRRVVAMLTGLTRDAVTAELVFTRLRRIVPVAGG